MQSWETVTKANPCPICGKPDWCGRGGEVVRCMRVTEADGWRVIKQDINGGTTFAPEGSAPMASPVLVEKPHRPTVDWSHAVLQMELELDRMDGESIAKTMGFSLDTLKKARSGWCKAQNAMSFPMHNGSGQVIGVRLRKLSGEKFAITGSRQGVFLPRDELNLGELVLVVEGPTDHLAALEIGLQAVGRPSCLGSVQECEELLRGKDVCIVADKDDVGRAGAVKLAKYLKSSCLDVRTIEPLKGKDLREWVASGATKETVETVWRAAWQK